MTQEPATSAVLKTLVLTDLVGSTKLVDRLGDERAFALFSRHDRLARDLLARYRGREIDKTDGFLLLFERPLEAVSYALAYHQALDELSTEMGVEMAARAGIHLGEVFLHQNSPEDVARGAKPLEVEGLAKPVAARLMGLAQGRQTLLTRTAFDVARRAAVGCTDLGDIRWVAHGRYMLKGVDEPVDVFEVGAVGFAPLAPPPDSEKAKRAFGDETILGWRPAPGQEVPRRPNWVLKEKLGEGGFGEVWLAQHKTTHDQLVFKFCFEAERLKGLKREVTLFRVLKEALGDRDDIARIRDWDFEQCPYFLESEYTAGGSLVTWAEEQGGIDKVPLPVRLEIVARIAEALGAAHSVGVLHKDLKPANILITRDSQGKPRAQLTDFGIGLILDRSRIAEYNLTSIGATTMIDAKFDSSSSGTYQYMAPELLEGKPPTIQADIYALGVILFQVVIGDLRRQIAPGWERGIEDTLLQDDIRSCVDGSPERRLASAIELSHRLGTLDTRRTQHMTEENQRRALERARRRRKVLIPAGAFLVIFAVAMAIQARRISKEAERANREAETARQVSEFMTGLFKVSNPSESRGNTITAREILDRGAEKIEKELADQPLVQAQMMYTIGKVYMSLGLYKQSTVMLEKSLAVREKVLGPSHADVAVSLDGLAASLAKMGKAKEAEPLMKRALQIREQILGENDLDTVKSMCNLANVYCELGKNTEAEELYRRALRIRLRRQGPDHPEVADVESNLGLLLSDTGRYKEAESLYKHALVVREARLGPDHLDVASTLGKLGSVYLVMERNDEAETLYTRAIAIQEKALGPDHPDLAQNLNNLGTLINIVARRKEAEALLVRALDIWMRALGAEHPMVIAAQCNLGEVYIKDKRFAEAEAILQQAITSCEKGLGSSHPYLAAALLNLTAIYAEQGRYGEAEPAVKRALAICERNFGDAHPWTAATAKSLADIHRDQRRYAEAEPLYARAIKIIETTLGPNHSELADTLRSQASLLRAIGRNDEARKAESRAADIEATAAADKGQGK